MKQFFKLSIATLSLLVLHFTMQAQTAVYINGLQNNTGPTGFGVGIGSNAFTVTATGVYNSTASTASDNFYDATGSGTPIEIAGAVAPAFYNLMLANGTTSAVTISNTAGLNVSGSLAFGSGIVTNRSVGVAGAVSFLSGNTGYTGTISNTRFVDGYVKQANSSSFTYPVGANGVYSPATFSNPSGSNVQYNQATAPNTATFATQGGGLQLAKVSTKEFYNLATSGSVNGNTITIPYGNFGPSGYVSDPNSLTIAGYDGTNWTNLSALVTNTINTGTKTVTVTLNIALSSFTHFALASTSALNALPVTLVSFTASASNCDGLLKWDVTTEINLSKYVVEHSKDGQLFTASGELNAKNNMGSTTYNYKHTGLSKGTNYFRLKLVGTDGKFTYSNIVMLVGNCGPQIIISPNPVKGTLYIRGLQKGSSVEVYNNLGQQMAKLTAVNFNDDSRAIDVSNYSKGDYFVRIVQDNKIIVTNKIIKL